MPFKNVSSKHKSYGTGACSVQPLDSLILASKGVLMAAKSTPGVVEGETQSGQDKDKSHKIFLDFKIQSKADFLKPSCSSLFLF